MDTPSNTDPSADKKALPGTHPNSLKNLKKPWEPGQTGNPAGRPKGARTIRNILDEMLNRYVDVEALKNLEGIEATIELCRQLSEAKNDLPDDIPPQARARLYDLMVAAQVTRAVRSGDLSSFRELVDRYEGAVTQKFEDVTPLKNAEDEEILNMMEGGQSPAMDDSTGAGEV
jgi:hypothetical protein